MTGLLGTVLQVVLVAAGAPLLVGLMRQIRARAEGRAGAGVLQPWRDLRKLLTEPITPHGTGPLFRMAPLVLAGTTLVVAAVIPLVTTRSPLDGAADLFAVTALLALGTVALALAGLDTGTAFGGMGASREMVVLALVEPTILLSTFALSVRVGSTNLGAIVGSTLDDPQQVVFPASLLALVALVVVVIAEAGRMPVDNPSTHLELTMIHEAMVLEYAGPDLALVEWASAMRLAVLLGLLSNLFVPWGLPGLLAMLPVGAAAIAAKVAVAGAALAAAEVFMAKLRMFRVPELLVARSCSRCSPSPRPSSWWRHEPHHLRAAARRGLRRLPARGRAGAVAPRPRRDRAAVRAPGRRAGAAHRRPRRPRGDAEVVALAVGVGVLRAGVLPWLLRRAMSGAGGAGRRSRWSTWRPRSRSRRCSGCSPTRSPARSCGWTRRPRPTPSRSR